MLGKIVERLYGQGVDQCLGGPGVAWRIHAAEVDGAEGLRQWLAAAPEDRVLVQGWRSVAVWWCSSVTGRRATMAGECAAPADLEEALCNLAALCEGLRAMCRHGEAGSVTLADLEPWAATAAYLAGALVQRVQGLAGGGGSAGGT